MITKKYLETDVLVEAKKRIKHTLMAFDSYAVAFSGGKDSLVTLNLVDEVKAEIGDTSKTIVIFRDEELIPDDVLDFVNEIRLSGKYDFRYFAIPLVSEKFILGEKKTYIQWDNNRKWIRPMPDYAITSPEPLDQYHSDAFTTQGMKGKKVIFTGVRADESLMRFKSITNKMNESYLCATAVADIKMCKPIYDWSQPDIFKYFYDKKIKYCAIYDMQAWNGESLRVSTPLHAESSKRIYKVRTRAPLFYQQLVDLFPEVALQERYYGQLSKSNVFEKYQIGWQGIIDWANENLTEKKHRDKVTHELQRVIKTRNKLEEQGSTNYGGYPILYVFKQMINGAYKRAIMPKKTATADEVEYEIKYAKQL